MKAKNRDPICAYCGVNIRKAFGVDPEEDHVIGRLFFPDRLKQGLPKVSSCTACNKGISSDEEYLRIILLTDTHCCEHPVAQEAKRGKHDIIGSTPFSRSILNKPSRRIMATNGIVTQDIYSEGGVFLGRQQSRTPDWQRIHRVCVKISRGLHYVKTGLIAPPSERYVVRFGGISEDNKEILIWMAMERQVPHSFADSAFQYTSISRDAGWTKNVWLLSFYNGFKILVVDNQFKAEMAPIG